MEIKPNDLIDTQFQTSIYLLYGYLDNLRDVLKNSRSTPDTYFDYVFATMRRRINTMSRHIKNLRENPKPENLIV